MSARVRRRNPRSGPSSDSTAKEMKRERQHWREGERHACARAQTRTLNLNRQYRCRTRTAGSGNKYSETVLVQSARARAFANRPRLRRRRSPFLSPLSTLSIYSTGTLSTRAEALGRSLGRLEECLLEFATRKEY